MRQGNQHDEIDLFAYATPTMWQNNERKARFIGAALSGDTSVRRLEDLGEGQANQFAMAKAIASGDPRLMQKNSRLRSLASNGYGPRISTTSTPSGGRSDAEREIDLSARRIGEIGEDIARLVPTGGDAFTMTVKDRQYAERKPAGRALMQEILTLVQLQHEHERVIASIGGFDVTFEGERFGRDGYRYITMLHRTGSVFEVELPMTVTALGAIARLEHTLSNFDGEQENYRRRRADAQRRLATYGARGGEAFAFAAELELKRAGLAEIGADLAKDGAVDDAAENAKEPLADGRRAAA